MKELAEKAESSRLEFKALELEVAAMRASKEVVDLTVDEDDNKENSFVLASPGHWDH